MAITGTFLADFSDFQAAVQQAEVSLKGFEAGAGKVETSLNRVTNSLSGTRLIQDATIMAEAVDRVGGVSKLTEKELARVSATAQEAAAKMRAMGMDVPPGIQKIADVSGTVTTSFGNMRSMVTSLAGAFGISFGVAGLVQFGKHVFSAASEIGDMAVKLGISTDAVQGFKFAAEQSGSTLDAVGTAINKMNINLAGDGKALAPSLKAANLSFEQLRAMKVEDAFLAITDAIETIENPMTQARVAQELLGKGAADLLAAIKANFRGVADEANKMSSDTIRDLKAAEDAWKRLATNVTIYSGNMIAAIGEVSTATAHLNSWQKVVAVVSTAMRDGWGAAGALAVAIDQVATATTKTVDTQARVPPVLAATAQEIAGVNKGLVDQARLAEEGAAWTAKMAKAEKDLYADMRAFGVKELRTMTAEVEKEMAAQRDLVFRAQMDILALMNESAAKQRIERLGGAQSLDAQLEALAAAHQANIMKIEAAGRLASSRGGEAWQANAQRLADEAERAFQSAWQAIVDGSAATVPPVTSDLGRIEEAGRQSAQSLRTEYVTAFQSIGAEADTLASRVAAVYGLAEQNRAMFSAGFNPGLNFGTASAINAAAATSAGLTIPQFAEGGEGDFGTGTLAMLHGRERITPLDKGGGRSGGSTINIYVTQPLGTPDAIARAVGDAFMGWMRSQGMRLPSGV